LQLDRAVQGQNLSEYSVVADAFHSSLTFTIFPARSSLLIVEFIHCLDEKKKKKKRNKEREKKISHYCPMDFNKSAPILTTTIKLILVESFGIFLQNPFFSRGSCVCGREALWSNIWYVAYIIHCLCSVSDGRVNSNMACI
jgi:hypothetical protein